MNLISLRRAATLLIQRDKIDKQLSKILAASRNGNGKTTKQARHLKHQGAYMAAVKKLPKGKRLKISKIYQAEGVKAAVAAAQKMVT